jgi:hypothetical protein
MKYFIDTEFFEDFHKPLFGKKRHFIDLISIGIVAEDGREYYAISKDFDLEKVWNKYDLKPDISNGGVKKVYWIRENVLKPIFSELLQREVELIVKAGKLGTVYDTPYSPTFCYKTLKELFKRHGKSNKQIAEEIIQFVYNDVYKNFVGEEKEFHSRTKEYGWNTDTPIEFYGYYADYDWCLFCSLFGRMIDLPKGFPMYMRDLKQTLDEKAMAYFEGVNPGGENFNDRLWCIKNHPNYPKQENEHSALHDARWNKELHEFLNKI